MLGNKRRTGRTGGMFIVLLVTALLVGPVLTYAAPVISAGFYHAMYLEDDGTLWAWGDNGYGQVGNGTTIDQTHPELVLDDVAVMSAGGLFSLAVESVRTLRAWGSNHYGQLGTATHVTPLEEEVSPESVPGLDDVIDVSAGGWHSLALKEDGTVWAWGRNNAGQLGINTKAEQPVPVQVKDPSGSDVLRNIIAISAGGWHSMALSEDGTIYTWGGNSFGQLGDGTTDDRLLPQAVPDMSDVRAISAGYFHSLAVHAGGQVAAWGDNAYGQLGDATTNSSRKPLTLSGLADVKDVSTGHYHSIALKEDGTVWTWGDNSEGQLGIGEDSLPSSHTPVLINELANIVMISAGGHFNLALAADGSGWSWGANEFGQLGDGTTVKRTSPVMFWQPGGGLGSAPTLPGSGESRSQTASSNRSESLDIDLYINNELHELIPKGSLQTRDDQRMVTVVTDEQRLAKEVEAAGEAPVVAINVHTESDKVTTQFSGELIAQMADLNAVLEIHTSIGNYILPLSELYASEWLASFREGTTAKELVISLHIGLGDRDALRLAEEVDEAGTFTLLTPPVDFTISVEDREGEQVVIDTFHKFIKREIPLPDHVDASEVTTAIILLEDGKIRHVPTAIIKRNGKLYASASSLSNSHYALISNELSFSDVEGHWAEAELEDFASRLIIFGAGDGRFGPDRYMTRAELTAMLVRALGITASEHTTSFHDVKEGDWYADVLAKAEYYGLITGYADGSFRPNEPVTRQEAIVMVYRASILAGLELDVENREEAESLLAQFVDGGEVSDWARREFASVLKLGLVIGSRNQLMPHKNITRSEQTVIVWRLLRAAELID